MKKGKAKKAKPKMSNKKAMMTPGSPSDAAPMMKAGGKTKMMGGGKMKGAPMYKKGGPTK